MNKAPDYALNQWPALLLFLENGRLDIDNNLIENAIRPTANGKKNWILIDEAHAGDLSVIICTVIECCRRRGLDPFANLRDVFTRLLLHDQLAGQRPHARSVGEDAAAVDLRATA